MIEFRQKEFSEYDAMRSLYKELMGKDSPWRNRINVIDSSSLLPVLRGNNVVIERFVISTMWGRKDRFRMYLKVGAKAKMPERFRLPGRDTRRKLWGGQLNINAGQFPKDKTFSIGFRQKEFGGGPRPLVDIAGSTSYAIELDKTVPVGETLEYNKESRSIVLEFTTIQDAIRALDILPFGINYKLYLLDV